MTHTQPHLQSFLLPNLQNPCSLFHSQSCRVIQSSFHFSAKHCTGSNMFIKAALCQLIKILQLRIVKGLWTSEGLPIYPCPAPSGTTSSSTVPNSKTEYFRNVYFILCFTYLMCPVLEALFICIHLLVTCSCSVEELIYLLVL